MHTELYDVKTPTNRKIRYFKNDIYTHNFSTVTSTGTVTSIDYGNISILRTVKYYIE